MKITKILFVLSIILLIALNVNALNYTIFSHTITAQINPEGNDKVIEKFFIQFDNETEKIAFREKSLELGTSTDAWKQLNEKFIPSLGENVGNKKIAYNEGTQNYLQISYDLLESIMAKGKEATMMTEYSIKANFFNSFYQSGLWIIPNNTTINIELPPGAEIRDTVEPQAELTKNVSRQVVSWQGYKSGNKLALTYILWKKMDPVVDLNALTAFLFKTEMGLILLVIVAIILVVIITKRKKIAETIEEYVEKNSQIQEE